MKKPKLPGEWSIDAPSDVLIEGDYGLIVRSKARHHAIAAKLQKPFKFDGSPFILQFVSSPFSAQKFKSQVRSAIPRGPGMRRRLPEAARVQSGRRPEELQRQVPLRDHVRAGQVRDEQQGFLLNLFKRSEFL